MCITALRVWSLLLTCAPSCVSHGVSMFVLPGGLACWDGECVMEQHMGGEGGHVGRGGCDELGEVEV